MSKINYKDFSVVNAQHITAMAEKNELERTIDTIIEFAEKGERAVFLKNELSQATTDELKFRGFIVEKLDDNRLFKNAIYWEEF